MYLPQCRAHNWYLVNESPQCPALSCEQKKWRKWMVEDAREYGCLTLRNAVKFLHPEPHFMPTETNSCLLMVQRWMPLGNSSWQSERISLKMNAEFSLSKWTYLSQSECISLKVNVSLSNECISFKVIFPSKKVLWFWPYTHHSHKLRKTYGTNWDSAYECLASHFLLLPRLLPFYFTGVKNTPSQPAQGKKSMSSQHLGSKGVQGHPGLYSDLEVSPSYISLCIKKTNKQASTIE